MKLCQVQPLILVGEIKIIFYVISTKKFSMQVYSYLQETFNLF